MTRRRQDGFTLLEMIVVLVIAGLMLSLIITRGPLHSTRLDNQAATMELTGALRAARGRAIAENRSVAVTLGPNFYRIDGADPHRVPADVTLGGNAAIRFAPDGSSSGGVIALQAGGSQATIAVDWLTGRVVTQQ
jgi:general secretion pathway protein H